MRLLDGCLPRRHDGNVTRASEPLVGIPLPLVTCEGVGSESGVDLEGFEVWYRREHPRLVGALMWLGGDATDVRDAVDEACARALERWNRVGAMESPTGWTYRVALNVWKRRERRRALERRVLRRYRPSETDVAGPAGEAWDLLRHLPPRERTAISLRYVGDLTEAQIAQAMGVRRSTVSVMLRRAHRRLAELLVEIDDVVET
jgi:RNA polymerase sigma-70 factor (ECF subfamily)